MGNFRLIFDAVLYLLGGGIVLAGIIAFIRMVRRDMSEPLVYEQAVLTRMFEAEYNDRGPMGTPMHRVERMLVFSCAGGEKKFLVDDAEFKALRKNTSGTLYYRGKKFVRFENPVPVQPAGQS